MDKAYQFEQLFKKNAAPTAEMFLKVVGGGLGLTGIFMLIVYQVYALMHSINQVFLIFLFLGSIALQAIWLLLLTGWLLPKQRHVIGQLGFVLADYHQGETYERTRHHLLGLEGQSHGETRWFIREIANLLYRVQQDWENLATTGNENWQLNQALQKTIEELERATQLKDEFIATMSHEFRTPLNSIIGYSSTLTNKSSALGLSPENSAQLLVMADAIYRNGQRLLRLVEQIMNLQRLELGRIVSHPITVELQLLVQDCYASLLPAAQKKHLQFELALHTALPVHIHIDPQLLRTVLLNLLDNAVKFTERGRVDLEVSQRDDLLIFVVRDTGIGIAASWHEPIFEEFRQVDQSYQWRYGGSGLGLAIVRKTLRALDGQVQLQSTVNEGSCFTVTVPLISVGVVDAELKRR